MLQLELPEGFRGRVLSLGMPLVKAASPLAFLASEWSLKLLPPYVSVFSGGICLLLLAKKHYTDIMWNKSKKIREFYPDKSKAA